MNYQTCCQSDGKEVPSQFTKMTQNSESLRKDSTNCQWHHEMLGAIGIEFLKDCLSTTEIRSFILNVCNSNEEGSTEKLSSLQESARQSLVSIVLRLLRNLDLCGVFDNSSKREEAEGCSSKPVFTPSIEPLNLLMSFKPQEQTYSEQTGTAQGISVKKCDLVRIANTILYVGKTDPNRPSETTLKARDDPEGSSTRCYKSEREATPYRKLLPFTSKSLSDTKLGSFENLRSKIGLQSLKHQMSLHSFKYDQWYKYKIATGSYSYEREPCLQPPSNENETTKKMVINI